jgi:hypothetical protein
MLGVFPLKLLLSSTGPVVETRLAPIGLKQG